MLQPIHRIAQESTETLKAMQKALLAKDGAPAMEDASLLTAIRAELTSRALGMYDETGFPTALHDAPDPFTW